MVVLMKLNKESALIPKIKDETRRDQVYRPSRQTKKTKPKKKWAVPMVTPIPRADVSRLRIKRERFSLMLFAYRRVIRT